MSSIGQAILGVAGGAIGAYFGGPAGFMMGAGLGMSLGGVLFPASSEIPGATPANLQIQTSQVGTVVKVIYGSRKVAGNLIRFCGFTPIGHESEAQGGKGGAGQTYTSYSYTLTMAWGICMSPAENRQKIINVWAGAALVPPTAYRVYDGSQTTADSALWVGETRAPVWKNLCYVVMENYDLGYAPYIPQFTFETGGDTGFLRTDADDVNYEVSPGTYCSESALFGTDFHVDAATNRLYIKNISVYAGTKSLCSVTIADATTLKIEKSYTTETTPAYTQKFVDSHVWPHIWKDDGVYVLAGTQAGGTVMTINAETDVITYYQFFGADSTYSIPQTIYTSDFDGHSDVGIFFGQLVSSLGNIYFYIMCSYFWHPKLWIGHVPIGGATWVKDFEMDTMHPYQIGSVLNFFIIPELNYAVTSYYAQSGQASRMLIVNLATQSVSQDWGPATVTDYPAGGINAAMYYDGKIWGNAAAGADPDKCGLISIDLTTVEVTFYKPSFDDLSDYEINQIVPAANGTLLIGTSSYGFLIFNITSGTFTQYNNTTLPGLDPTALPEDDFPSVGYNSATGMMYAGSYQFYDGWSGVVALGAGVAVDVLPPDVTSDILTNDLYGLGLSSTYLSSAVFEATKTYCFNNDLLVSMVFDHQMSVLDALAYVIQHHNGYISYYDGLISHGQLEYTTPTQTLTRANSDFVEDSDYPINISKAGERSYNNKIEIEYSRRDGEYVSGIALADDILDIDTYRLKELSIKLDGLCTFSRAEKMAWLLLKKSLLQPQDITFKVGPKSRAKVVPAAILSITDDQTEISSLPVRILSVGEDIDRKLQITCKEESADIYDWTLAGFSSAPEASAPVENLHDVADAVIRTVGFLADAYYTDGNRTVVVVYSKPSDSTSWAGASVYQAYSSGGTYTKKATQPGSGVIGTVSAVGDDSGTKYITVVLDTDATLVTSNATDMAANKFVNLFYAVGKGYGRFETVELVGTNTWTLTDLVWDTTGLETVYLTDESGNKLLDEDSNYIVTKTSAATDNSYGDIAANDVMVFYYGTMNFITLLDSELAMTLYYKTPSFNLFGLENSLSGITVTSVVV